MLSTYKSKAERKEQLQDIAAALPTANPGDTFTYRGLVLEKASDNGRRRTHSIVHVKAPRGIKLDTFDLIQVGDREARKYLDELRGEA